MRLHRVPGGLLTGMLGLGLAAGAVHDATPHRRPLLPTVEELGYWQLGQVLKEEFPAGSGVGSPIREALVAGELQYCPRQVCPVVGDEEEFWRCLSVMKVDCAGDAPLGYVVTDAGLPADGPLGCGSLHAGPEHRARWIHGFGLHHPAGLSARPRPPACPAG